MCLQVRCNIGQKRIRGRVRLGETVTGKLLHQVEDLFDLLLRIALLLAAGQEARTLRSHLFRFFLAHGPAQDVGFAQRISRQAVRDLHHLFLVDNDAIGLFQDFFQLREIVGDLFTAKLAVDEVVDHAALDWAGPIERVQSA